MTTLMREDSTLKILVFHGNGKEDPKQRWLVCEAIWSIMQKVNDHVKIALLETMFRYYSFAWYMKFKSTTSTKVGRTLVEIQQALFKEFQKLKVESQCIIEIKYN